MTTTDTLVDDAHEAGRVSDLLKTTSRLIGVLEREIEMLRAMDPRGMQALQEEKIVLAAAYESQVKSLNERPETMHDLDPALRDELAEATERFQATLDQNQRRLRAAKQATDSVLRAVVDAVEKQQSADRGYAADGAYRRPHVTAAAPFTLNKSF